MNVNSAGKNRPLKKIGKKQEEVKQEAIKKEAEFKEATAGKSLVSADAALNFLEQSKPCISETRRTTTTIPEVHLTYTVVTVTETLKKMF